MQLSKLVSYLEELLMVDKFRDYAPNGLQVAGKDDIDIIVSGVTASQRLIDMAIDQKADAVLVHHGYFWKGESAVITGMKFARIKALIEHEIALLAYHLPLDAHPVYGNNAQLAQRIGLKVQGEFCYSGGAMIGLHGEISAIEQSEFAAHLTRVLGREALAISGGAHAVSRVGICTGGAQDYIEEAAALGLDAFVSGEISEKTTHQARELGIHYYAAGHHATERYGVQALGAHLESSFGLTHCFFDDDNPA